ncbi:MAG TPA: sugar kinase [Patescibacteria group bacterium]|nr:sugar kinase [Patescibacteria group bacterium]
MAAAGPEVVTLGECLMAFVGSDPGPLAGTASFLPYVAGAEANVAVGLARLGRSVAFIGRVGDDGLGVRIARSLRAEGVDVAGLAVDPDAPTGVMIRERPGLGPSEVVYARTGSAGSRLGPDDVAAAAERGSFAVARWLHLTGITPALSSSCRAAQGKALDAARAAGATVSLDLNLRRRLWTETEARQTLAGLAARVDVVIADTDEAAVVTGQPPDRTPAELAAALLRLGPSLAVLKLGAAGSLALGPDGIPRSVPAVPVAVVVDPVGAGDAFCAGFIDARLDGRDLSEALARANACGAAAVAALGDQTGLPSSAELARIRAVGGPDTLR